MTPAPPWSIAFTDGCNNHYAVVASQAGVIQFEYTPMTPERSSSGLYSGGAPRRGVLVPPQVAELWAHVRTLIEQTASHVELRTKGTAVISTRVDGICVSYRLAASEPRSAFETWLSGLGPGTH